MKKFTYRGFVYEVITRPWKKGDSKFEVIRWEVGYKNLWERISYKDYLEIKLEFEKR